MGILRNLLIPLMLLGLALVLSVVDAFPRAIQPVVRSHLELFWVFLAVLLTALALFLIAFACGVARLLGTVGTGAASRLKGAVLLFPAIVFLAWHALSGTWMGSRVFTLLQFARFAYENRISPGT